MHYSDYLGGNIRSYDKGVLWAGDSILSLYISGGYTGVFIHHVHQCLHLKFMNFPVCRL